MAILSCVADNFFHDVWYAMVEKRLDVSWVANVVRRGSHPRDIDNAYGWRKRFQDRYWQCMACLADAITASGLSIRPLKAYKQISEQASKRANEQANVRVRLSAKADHRCIHRINDVDSSSGQANKRSSRKAAYEVGRLDDGTVSIKYHTSNIKASWFFVVLCA